MRPEDSAARDGGRGLHPLTLSASGTGGAHPFCDTTYDVGRSKTDLCFRKRRRGFREKNVTRGGEEVPFTPMEFKTLEFMTRHPHQVVSRDELLNEVWGYQNYPCTRTVDSISSNCVKSWKTILRSRATL
jgi:hypothetical protein